MTQYLCLACKVNPTPPDALQCESCLKGGTVAPAPTPAAPVLSPARQRLVLTLPWSALASDNKNVSVTGDKRARQQFRDAKAKATELLREAYGPDREKISTQVSVTVLLHVPDNRVRDGFNFAKAAMDALKAAVLTDDKWQVARRGAFDVAGIDPDRPRAVIHIEPYVPLTLSSDGG